MCGDLLYCDISALETVCSDILLKGDETTGNEVRNTRNKRSSQTNSEERVQKILIRFKMIGEFSYTEIIKMGKSQKVLKVSYLRKDVLLFLILPRNEQKITALVGYGKNQNFKVR